MNPKPEQSLPGTIRTVAAGWLLFLAAYGLGMATLEWELWPYRHLADAWSYIAGDDVEQTTLAERVLNDFGLRPARHLVESQRNYAVPDHYQPLEVAGLSSRRAAPLVYFAPDAPRGYRLVYGTFDFEDGLHGAILLAPDGTVQRRWTVSQEDVEWALRGDENVYPHGIEIFPDGSIVVAFDGGTSLARYGYCGELLWRTRGAFHHSVTREGADAVWAWGAPDGSLEKETPEHMVKVAVADGRVLEAIFLDDVWPANPAIDPFAIRQRDQADGSFWEFDRFHVNDVDPLPAEFAMHYPQFEAGDLLISLRSINLVAVIAPQTLEVKWWRQGLVRRQHDPDWNDRGTITIFDNNMNRGYSRIQEIDPRTMASRIVVPGEPYDFYTWHRGKHDVLPDGGYLVTSTEQGRLFEVDGEGEVVFDFINRFQPGSGYLAVSEGRFLPTDYFEELPACEG